MGKKKKLEQRKQEKEFTIPDSPKPGSIVRVQVESEKGLSLNYYVITSAFKNGRLRGLELELEYVGQEEVDTVLEKKKEVFYRPNTSMRKFVGVKLGTHKLANKELFNDGNVVIGQVVCEAALKRLQYVSSYDNN